MSKFTPEEDQFLIENFLTMPITKIAKEINRSEGGVTGRMKKLELVIPEEIIEERKLKGRFVKGQRAINKGVPMREETKEKIKHTFFANGHTPHNFLPAGSEVVRVSHGKSYIMFKLPDSRKLIYKHIWVWENHHSKKVPKGYNVIFKNGNTLDLTPENLECISNKELLERNSIKNYPPELQRVIKLKNKIKRHINGSERKKSTDFR